jgi:ubiquinone/menaquinone biosynthesis C-methylase UbiE
MIAKNPDQLIETASRAHTSHAPYKDNSKMTSTVRSDRSSQIVGWAVLSLFVAGNFLSVVGAWTGPVIGVWLVGTQKPRRGFLWLLALSFLPGFFAHWRKIPLDGPEHAIRYLTLALLTATLAILPLTFHRLVSPHLAGFFSTLPFPLAAVAIPALVLALHAGAVPQAGPKTVLITWFAATLVWMWNRESRATSAFLGAGFVVATALELIARFTGVALPAAFPNSTIAGYSCLGGALFLAIWALFHPFPKYSWANRRETVARLQSPFTGEALQVAGEPGHEALVSRSGERFPVRNGIPTFLKPEDLTGDNGKYNRLYDLIGGFYNDIQRVYSPLKGFYLEDYFLSYMRLLEVKPGDSVLETSVGTGLNFKYLPHGVKLSGLDLSPEMLANCQSNLRRWQMEADLYLCNAESLPFADNCFDVVFHVGGINFFNDRAKAIREMIRVAKPGSLLLIADETEKHVKEVYEKGLGGFFKNRKEPVSAPIDLLPPEMQEVHLESLKSGMFYALTFRKPRENDSEDTASADKSTGGGKCKQCSKY